MSIAVSRAARRPRLGTPRLQGPAAARRHAPCIARNPSLPRHCGGGGGCATWRQVGGVGAPGGAPCSSAGRAARRARVLGRCPPRPAARPPGRVTASMVIADQSESSQTQPPSEQTLASRAAEVYTFPAPGAHSSESSCIGAPISAHESARIGAI